jgi:hypothetical protein
MDTIQEAVKCDEKSMEIIKHTIQMHPQWHTYINQKGGVIIQSHYSLFRNEEQYEFLSAEFDENLNLKKAYKIKCVTEHGSLFLSDLDDLPSDVFFDLQNLSRP